MVTTAAPPAAPEDLRAWLAERQMSASAFARAIGRTRNGVYRWATETENGRKPDLPLALVCQGIEQGARGANWTPGQLADWMERRVFDQLTLSKALGVNRSTISRWLDDSPNSPVPYWLPLALAVLDKDGDALRARRKARRAAQEAAVAKVS